MLFGTSISRTGAEDMLKDEEKEFTVFCPDDDAMGKFAKEMGVTKLSLYDLEGLPEMVKDHIVEGKFPMADLPEEITTLSGKTVPTPKVVLNRGQGKKQVRGARAAAPGSGARGTDPAASHRSGPTSTPPTAASTSSTPTSRPKCRPAGSPPASACKPAWNSDFSQHFGKALSAPPLREPPGPRPRSPPGNGACRVRSGAPKALTAASFSGGDSGGERGTSKERN